MDFSVTMETNNTQTTLVLLPRWRRNARPDLLLPSWLVSKLYSAVQLH